MRTGLIGKKIGNSSFFNDKGKMIPVTLVKVEECVVSDVKTQEKNGYSALQIASIEENLKLEKVNKPQKKLFTKIKSNPKKFLKEFRIDQENILEIGTKINLNHFKKGQSVDVTGTSIGKGFAGSMKRHNFAGGRASHGASVSHRAHGSTGHSQDPGRVFKGKKMAGHMGDKKRTIQNLEIIKSDVENNLIFLKGSIPGSKNTLVFIKKNSKKINRLSTLEKNKKLQEMLSKSDTKKTEKPKKQEAKSTPTKTTEKK